MFSCFPFVERQRACENDVDLNGYGTVTGEGGRPKKEREKERKRENVIQRECGGERQSRERERERDREREAKEQKKRGSHDECVSEGTFVQMNTAH